jgi:hypothetical protein
LGDGVMPCCLSLRDGQGAVELGGGEWLDHDVRRM